MKLRIEFVSKSFSPYTQQWRILLPLTQSVNWWSNFAYRCNLLSIYFSGNFLEFIKFWHWYSHPFLLNQYLTPVPIIKLYTCILHNEIFLFYLKYFHTKHPNNAFLMILAIIKKVLKIYIKNYFQLCCSFIIR